MKELLKFIEVEDERLKNYYGPKLDREKRILANTVKLTEELGELCNEVLSHQSLQRKQKMESHQDHLSEEFADVLITTLLLAKSMNVDIQTALAEKIEKINARYN